MRRWSFDEVQSNIPNPVLKKVPVDYFGLPWWKKAWLYLTEPTEYEYNEDWYVLLPDGTDCFVPKGERTDGASIPWFLRFLLTSFGPLLRGACLHDFGYRNGYLLDWNGEKFAVGESRKYFDDLFRKVIVWTTALDVIGFIAWSGVRPFGFIAWNKNKVKRGDR